jgi:hypothetical protein
MFLEYIFLAAGCVIVGSVLTVMVLGYCQSAGISIENNVWVLAVPAVFSLFLNVSLLELYRKYFKKHN